MTHLLAEGGYQIFTLHSVEKTWLYFALVCAVASIVVALFLVRGVLAADQGTASMKDIAKAIQEGAEAFLARQFKTIGIIIVPLAVLIFFTATKVTHVNALGHTITDLSFVQAGIYRVICFLAGALCSGLTGFIGMSLAVRGNVRTAAAAREGKMAPALKVAYRTGAITGLLCVGLGLLGTTVIVLIFQNTATSVLIGFAFGASLLALFMRVGRGVITNAAARGCARYH
jgi:K(+)-stimulated pyrophosphate-energized sodium pump